MINKMKILKSSIFPSFIIFLLVFSEIFVNHFELLKYMDEIVTIIMFIYIIYVFGFKKVKIKDEIRKILILYLLIILIGIISNFFSNLQNNYIYILYDILTFSKIIITPIAFSLMINKRNAEDIIKINCYFSKMFLIIGFVCSIVSLFVNIGMRGHEARYGINSFTFIFKYEHIYSMMVLYSLLMVKMNNKNKKNLLYIIISAIQMILTTKGPSIIWAISVFAMIFFMNNKKRKVSILLIVTLSCITILFGRYQIETYLKNENSPRMILYKYGFITAKKYFPLGSGFATYGSDMAAKHYSELYRKYGFDNMYGMSDDNIDFLKDCYWPMIMGQFGFIGLIIGVLILYNFYKIIIDNKMERFNKAIVFSVFFYTILHSLGSSTLTTSTAVLLYIGIATSLKSYEFQLESEKI